MLTLDFFDNYQWIVFHLQPKNTAKKVTKLGAYGEWYRLTTTFSGNKNSDLKLTIILSKKFEWNLL